MDIELLDGALVPDRVLPIKREAREFAQEYIAPNAERYFRTGEYPYDLVDPAVEAGFVGAGIDKEYGGRGISAVEKMAIAEEFYRADAGIGMALQGRAFGANIVEAYGTEAQRERYLPPITSGEEFTGMAISEPETGSDLAGMQTTAERDGDEWVLNGEKYWIGNGVDADWITVYARTGKNEDERYDSHSMIIVPTDAEGYEADHIPAKMGMRASQQAHIVFEDCRVPAENLVGEEGEAFQMLTTFFNEGRVGVGGHGIGLAAAAIEEAWDFVHSREEFGKNVSEFQSVQHDLADMRTEFESARSLAWRAVEKVETDADDAGAWAAMTKIKATETAAECAETGVKLHGGRGILDERRIARVYRDVRLPMTYEGANPIQRDLVYRHF